MFSQYSAQQHGGTLELEGMDVLFDIDINPAKGATVTANLYHPCGLPLPIPYCALSKRKQEELLRRYSPVALAGLYSQLCVAIDIEANDHAEEKFILAVLHDPSVAVCMSVSYDGMKWSACPETLQYLADLVESATRLSH